LNFFSKKDSEKLAGLENGCYICTPAKRGKFIERLAGFGSEKGKEIFLKKLQKTFAG